MNSKTVTLFVVLAAIFAVEGRDMTGSLTDTLRIVTRVCLRCDIVTEDTAKEFFGCYDQAPGKDQFLKCQQQELKGLMDSKQNIKKACSDLPLHPDRLVKYSSCIKTEMAAAGVSDSEAVSKVNACQGKVLKLE